MKCIWPDEERQYFNAKITKKFKNGKYNVYFTDDHKRLTSVVPSNIKKLDGGGSVNYQQDLIGKTFFDEGGTEFMDGEDFQQGEFTVKSIYSDNKRRFVCICQRTVFDDDEPEDVKFFMSYVLQRVKVYENE